MHIPTVSQVGGFSITSIPSEARHSKQHHPYLELAVQKSPRNPPAAWLWSPPETILGKHLKIRVGGGFTWPPKCIELEHLKKVVFVAGGMGIKYADFSLGCHWTETDATISSPLISMLSQIVRRPGEYGGSIPTVHFIYASKGPEDGHNLSEVLFLDRLQSLSKHLEGIGRRKFTLDIFLSPFTKIQGALNETVHINDTGTRHGRFHRRRFTNEDLIKALGESEEIRRGTVVYVCGPPAMTDAVVDFMSRQNEMSKERVLCEKWW